MKLHELKPARGHRKVRKRVGRGNGSGHGNFSTRGVKGQRARAGGKAQMPGFEGGQTPLWKKLPKRGFNNFNRKRFAWINLKRLEETFEDGDEVTPEVLKSRRLIKQFHDGLKVLGEGELGKKLTVHAHAFSASARAKIEAAGGEAVLLADAAGKGAEAVEQAAEEPAAEPAEDEEEEG